MTADSLSTRPACWITGTFPDLFSARNQSGRGFVMSISVTDASSKRFSASWMRTRCANGHAAMENSCSAVEVAMDLAGTLNPCLPAV